MREIILEKRYPHSREEDITDAFIRGYEIGKEQEHRWWSAFCANCKTEPTTQTETQNSNLTFEKRTMRDCYNCKRYETEGECIECHYEPKDEPQDECAKEYEELGLRKLKELRKDEPQTEDLQDWKDRMWAEAIVTEPQTERSE